MKKCITLILALLTIINIIPTSVLAAELEPAVVAQGSCSENAMWTLTDDGHIAVTGSGEMECYSFDSTHRTPLFDVREQVLTASIENGITTIGDGFFLGCESLQSVEIPESVTLIGEYAFYCCYSMDSIEIPESVTEIKYRAFERCKTLDNVIIPDSVTKLGQCVFSRCENLKSVKLSDNITILDNCLFAYCGALESIEIPESVTEIHTQAFLKTGFKSFSITEGVTKIEDSVFEECEKLEYLYIPSTVKDFGLTSANEATIVDCPVLTTIEVSPESTYYTVVDGVVFTKDMKTLVYYPEGLNNTSYTIPDGTETIGAGAFFGNMKLTEVIMPDTITTIKQKAFKEAETIERVQLSKNIKIIEHRAFKQNLSLKEIELPDTLEIIEESAFLWCEALETITLPGKIKFLPDQLFYGCVNLKEVVILNPECGFYSNKVVPEHTTITSYPNGETHRNTRIYGKTFKNIETGEVTEYVLDNQTFMDLLPTENIVAGAPVSMSTLSRDKVYGTLLGYTTPPINEPDKSNKYYQEIKACVEELTADCTTQREKSNAIFKWVYENLEYTSSFAGNTIDSVYSIWRTRKGGCECFALIYSFMLYLADVPNGIAVGGSHCWNVVLVEEGWVLVDCQGTWGFDLEPNEYYYQTNIIGFTSGDVFYIVENIETIAISGVDVVNVDTTTDYYIEAPDFVTKVFKTALEENCHIIGKKDSALYNYAKENCKHVYDNGDTFEIQEKHIWVDIPRVSATCTENGTTFGRQCEICQEFKIKPVVIEATGHREVAVSQITPTCTKDGRTAGSKCSKCDLVFTPWETIPATGHNFSDKWSSDVAPTCTETGIKSHHCLNCNAKTDETVTEAKGHLFRTATVKRATCTTEGLTRHICRRCKYTEDEIIPATGHNISSEWTVDKEPTCTETGEMSHHCTKCDQRFDITEMPKGEHTYGNWVIDDAGTCLDNGSKHKTCLNCTDTITETIFATGHNYPTKWTIDKKATCTENGSQYKTCTKCNNTITTVIEATGHNYSTEWTIDKKATCKEEGSKSHHCENCGEKTDITAIPTTDHLYSDWVIDKEPTCTEPGLKFKVCADCIKMVVEHIPAVAHKFSDEWTVDEEATCIEEGSKSHHCENCNEKTDVTAIPTTDHNYGKWIIDTKPTCTENGSKHKECSGCDKEITEAVEATGHNYSTEWTVDKEATCVEEGSKSHHCVNCDVKTDVTAIPTTDHNYGEWIVEREATCTENGVKYKKCNSCEKKIDDVIVAKGHTESDWVVDKAATCTETGSKFKECTDCGIILETETIAENGHTSSDWFIDTEATVHSAGSKHKECSECGEILETAKIAQLKCSKPKLKTISNTTSGVKITWSKVSGADKYRVYRKTKSGEWKYLGSTSKTGYTDKTAKSGTKYYYAVKARNEAGNSSLSSSLSKYYLADPTLKTPKSTKSGISLKWTKVTGAQGYVIYRKTGSGSYEKLKTENDVSNLSYVDNSAKKGKKYTYKVKAYYSKTDSAYSNTKTITDKY